MYTFPRFALIGSGRPARPAMPTEALSLGVDLDRFSASAMAEIELRGGYEGEPRAALAECVKPLQVDRMRAGKLLDALR
ncbi:hypothetical protein D3C86_1916610 [compost metagenome]